MNTYEVIIQAEGDSFKWKRLKGCISINEAINYMALVVFNNITIGELPEKPMITYIIRIQCLCFDGCGYVASTTKFVSNNLKLQ